MWDNANWMFPINSPQDGLKDSAVSPEEIRKDDLTETTPPLLPTFFWFYRNLFLCRQLLSVSSSKTRTWKKDEQKQMIKLSVAMQISPNREDVLQPNDM